MRNSIYHLSLLLFTYLKCFTGSSQLPSLMQVDKSAKVCTICSGGKLVLKANASFITSDSLTPPRNELVYLKCYYIWYI